MVLNTKNNEVLRSFIGPAKDMDGNHYTVKVISYRDPVATTQEHGDIHSGAFIEKSNGEIVSTVLYQLILSEEEVQKEAEDRINNVEKYIQTKTGK